VINQTATQHAENNVLRHLVTDLRDVDRGHGPDEDDRTHLDLWADGELECLVSLGVRRAVDSDYPDGAGFVGLAETEGNVFCVVA